MSADDLLSSYDYLLPRELIAAHPLPERDASRLLVLDRRTRELSHRKFVELPTLLQPGDLLVLNETRVIPARLAGVRARTGGKWTGLYLGSTPDGAWRVMGQTRGRLQPGESLLLHPIHSAGAATADRLELRLEEKEPDGIWRVRPTIDDDPLTLLARFGTVPLPPYMGRDVAEPADWDRYQTTYARSPGAVAAPTAGLHFTPQLFEQCRARGVSTATVTLHVGVGTFRPISVENLADHQMHAEWCELPAATVDAIQTARDRGGRVVAVGTTTVRTLESAVIACDDELRAWAGETQLFIRPPFRFRVVDALITNFHLPQSSLVVMVSALADREFILGAYREAVQERYRFFSYGDAMLIV